MPLAAIQNPFLALQPFGTEDAKRFFGRETDLVLMESRICSSRTTLLFAGSGVGKTSFLNACLIPSFAPNRLTRIHRRWAAQPPLEALQESITSTNALPSGLSLLDRLRKVSADADSPGECLLILDQFEETFQYWRDTKALDDLAMEIARIVHDPSIDARVVISMREDFLGELSLFDNLIPDLFNNSYRLKHPTRSEAEDIIRKTAYLESSIECGPGLDFLLDDLLVTQRGGYGRVHTTVPSSHARVPMPFLQVVCHRLWEREIRGPSGESASTHRFIETYSMGRARRELEGYCGEKLDALDLRERDLVSAALGFLMTPGGGKMAYPLDVLATHAELPEEPLGEVLRKLSTPEIRILTELKPGGRGTKPWYELYHDLYADFLAAWKSNHDKVWKPHDEKARLARQVDTFSIELTDDSPDAEARHPAKSVRLAANYADARVVTMSRLRGEGAGTQWAQIITLHERIKAYTNREKGSLPTEDELIRFGGLLFDTLFQGEVRRLYDVARSRGRKLRIVLTSMVPWISEKPWEFCYDTTRRSFLATEDVEFVRSVLTAIPAEPIVPQAGPLRILVVCGQQVGFGDLSTEHQIEVIRRGFEPLTSAGLAVVEVLPAATAALIHDRLSTSLYTVLHFIGHGTFDERSQQSYLVLEDERGGSFRLPQSTAAQLFCRRGLSLVFLSSTQTSSGGRPDFNKGIAQSLMAQGLPALVANQYNVLDASATSFAYNFYRLLAQGLSLGGAAREARVAVNYSLQGEFIDWAVPVLYARDASETVCRIPARELETMSARAASTEVSGILKRPFRLGVWDVDDAFPALDRTLKAMNGAQEVFGFELTHLSAPLDLWDLEHVKEGTAYLRAERLAARLQSKPGELGLNVLICLTRQWLRDDAWLNLSGWWPDSQKSAVVMISVAGFQNWKVEGRDTDRAITNMVVSVLAGFLGDISAHAKGARSCPLAFDESRDVKNVTGVKKFDARCRQQLRRKLPNELPALEALLGTFS